MSAIPFLLALLLTPAGKAAPTPAPAPDPLQAVLETRGLQSAYNPVLLAFLTEEAKGRLPETQRKAALEQLVAGFRQEIQVRAGQQAVAGLATALGAVLGGAAGQGISEGAAQVWTDWVNAAFTLQKAGYKEETTPFFQNCLETFPYDELRARCAAGLAAADPDKAFSVLIGLLDSKNGEEVNAAALRLLGRLAASEGFPQEKKDAVVDELIKRTHGMLNTSLYPAAIDGLMRAKDPRAVEPLRGLTKGMMKGPEVKRAALRALLLGYADAGAREALQKDLKGGFMKEPKDQVAAALVLIEAGDAAGLDFALQYLSKKKKKDPDFSPELVFGLVERGDDAARGILAKAVVVQDPGDWIAADMAIGMLSLGDASAIEIVRSALGKKDWPETRIRAAVALAGQKDYSGIPVLKQMTESEGLLKTAFKLALGNAPDVESMRVAVASGLGRIDHKDAVPILTALLQDKSDRVRLAAAYALSGLKDPAALDGLPRALETDYGKEGSRSRNPEVRAHLLRSAASRFPEDPRTAALLKAGSATDVVSVKFLALAETRMASR
jgi:HEAT repeat protein